MDKNPHSRRVLDLGVGEVFFSSICHAGLDALSRGHRLLLHHHLLVAD